MFNKKEKKQQLVEEELKDKQLSVEFYFDTNLGIGEEEVARDLGFELDFVKEVRKEMLLRDDKKAAKVFLVENIAEQFSPVDARLSMESLDVQKVIAFIKTFEHSNVGIQIRIKGEF